MPSAAEFLDEDVADNKISASDFLDMEEDIRPVIKFPAPPHEPVAGEWTEQDEARFERTHPLEPTRIAGTSLDIGQGPVPTLHPPPDAGTAEKIASGLWNTAAGIPNFLATPAGAATVLVPPLAAGTRLAAPIAKALKLGFTALMTKATAEQAGKASVTGDPQDITEAAGAAALTGAGAAFGDRLLPDRPMPPKVTPEPFTTPEAQTALAERSRSILPQAESALREVPPLPEQPTTPEVSDASSLETPATVHANVPALPVEGTREVPTQEGGEGVLTPEVQQQGQVPLKRYPSTDAAQPDAVPLKPGDVAPVRFVSVQQGAAHIGWYEPIKPFVSGDGGLYYPNENGTVKLTSRQIKDAGFEIPPDELAKFKAAGGVERTAVQIPPAEPSARVKKVEASIAMPDSPLTHVEGEIEKKQQPEMIGMGGAVPGEFEPGGGTATSNKNTQVDKERAQRGLPPMMAALKQTWGAAWDKAMAMIDQDFGYPDKLISELKQKPRALEDFENAALLNQRVNLRNEYDKSTCEGARAYDDGRLDDVAEANLRTAQWSDRLTELEQATKSAGTESGRSLSARKMMANDDFTLAKMELDKRAANGFRPLTNDERAELVELHSKLAASEKALADYQATSQERISKSESAKAIAEMQRDEASQPKIHPAILAKAESIVAGFERRADAARARLKERLGRTSAGVDPLILKDLAEIGLGYLSRGALDFGKWSAKMVGELGDMANPYLADAFAESKRLLEDGLKDATPAVRNAVKRSRDVGEQIAAAGEAIEKKVTAGRKNEIAGQVQRLARLFVKRGVKDREELIDKVHQVLVKAIPGITRRETMDAISGYGDFKQLTKDQVSVQLRGMKGEMQQIAKLEDMAKGEPPAKSGVERRTPTEAERQLIKLVNKAKFEFQVPITDPSTQLKSALDTYKTTLRNQITDLQAKLDAKDYSKAPRRELKLDNEAMRLKSENERLKQKFRLGLAKDRLKARNWWQKTMDAVVKWRRGFILSGPVTLAKLTAAAIARGVITPLEEGVGAGISKAIPSVAAKARREGGASLTAESKAISEGFTRGMQDAWKTLRTGQSDLDLVFGKGEHLPQSFIDIFGNIHGALKAPVKRAEFERSFQKRAESYAKEGVDVTDEFVQTKIGLEAYQDAMRSIFMQKNIVNDAYKDYLRRYDRLEKSTGRPTPAGALIGTAHRVLLPIVKVPTNIVSETMQYAVGSVTGSARLGLAFKRGIENLKPQEADLIMRHLKKGSLGFAAMLTGFLAPQVFGGFYQQGQKRSKQDIPPDAARVNGVDIPPQYIHNPFLTAAQVGATVRRVSDSKLRKRDAQTQGLSHGAVAAALGLADATPFIREMTEIEKAMNPYQRDQWTAEMTRSMLVPQALQSVANQLDKDAKGETIKRKAVGPLQGVESGIPGLRQTLPKKP